MCCLRRGLLQLQRRGFLHMVRRRTFQCHHQGYLHRNLHALLRGKDFFYARGGERHGVRALQRGIYQHRGGAMLLHFYHLPSRNRVLFWRVFPLSNRKIQLHYRLLHLLRLWWW